MDENPCPDVHVEHQMYEQVMAIYNGPSIQPGL
jgi:hypothetical protein